MSYSILRLPGVLTQLGFSRSTVYVRISEGTLPAPVSLGGRAVGWPDYEIHAVNQARLQGKSDDEIKDMVSRLMAARTAPGDKLVGVTQ